MCAADAVTSPARMRPLVNTKSAVGQCDCSSELQSLPV